MPIHKLAPYLFNLSELILGTKEYHRLWKQEYRKTTLGKAGQLLGSAKTRASKKNLEVTITKEWILEKLNQGVCELSGVLFDMSPSGRKNRNPKSPSIDRINSSLGYTPENSRIILLSLNDALNQYGLEHFLEMAKAVINYQKDKHHGRLQKNR